MNEYQSFSNISFRFYNSTFFGVYWASYVHYVKFIFTSEDMFQYNILLFDCCYITFEIAINDERNICHNIYRNIYLIWVSEVFAKGLAPMLVASRWSFSYSVQESLYHVQLYFPVRSLCTEQ